MKQGSNPTQKCQQNFPLYRETDPIYGDSGEIMLPLALVEKIRQTEKARLLMNVKTGAEAWFPQYIFSFHFHCLTATEMVIFLSIPDVWVKEKKEFFV